MSYKLELEEQLHKYIERKNKHLSEINALDIVINLTKDKIKTLEKEANALTADGPVYMPDDMPDEVNAKDIKQTGGELKYVGTGKQL